MEIKELKELQKSEIKPDFLSRLSPIEGGAQILSPVRFLRANRQAINAAAAQQTETQEIDFQLGVGQGVKILEIQFDVGTITPQETDESGRVLQTLHIETGALEALSIADDFILNSEVMAYCNRIISEAAGTAETGIVIDKGHDFWDYKEYPGQGMLLAQNPTYQVIVNDHVVSDVHMWLAYQYVELTQRELAEAFILRR